MPLNREVQNDGRSIKRLKDEQQIRQRPAPTFGTNDEKGAANSIYEVIANSIDEAREGYGKEIRIKVEADGSVEVSDDGRGLPMDWNEDEQEYNWVLTLCTLYASGKYDSSQYGQALGLNGLGLTATQYASEYMDVWSTYGNKTRYMHFEKGKPVGEMKLLDPIKEGTGTTIKFKPDPEVFPALRTKEVEVEYFISLLRRQAMLLTGLKIVFNHYKMTKPLVLMYENGIVEFIDAIAERPLLPKTVEFEGEDFGTDDVEAVPEKYKVNLRLAFNFSRSASLIEVYHNASHMFEGGSNLTVDALSVGFAKAFTDYARSINKLNKSDKFVYKDIESILVCVASSDAPGNRTWFKNQTKGAINNPFIGQAMVSFVYQKVRYWLDNGKALSDKILTEVLANKQAREEADKVSKKVINSLSKNVGFGNKPRYFADCESKLVSERELYIVEGRSALGSVKTARNSKFQAVIAIRGKIINCLKEKLSRVLSSEIIIDLFRVFGCGIEAKSEYINNLPKFDITKLNWGKIIICTDADVDGKHIICLLITMFYVLAPSLLKNRKVYIAESPLYEIKCKKETRFAYSDKERDDILQELKDGGARDNQIVIQRSKGLGENDADMMALSTMNVLTRRLIPVEYPENDADLSSYFNALLGDDIETRRLLIEEYFELTEDDID